MIFKHLFVYQLFKYAVYFIGTSKPVHNCLISVAPLSDFPRQLLVLPSHPLIKNAHYKVRGSSTTEPKTDHELHINWLPNRIDTNTDPVAEILCVTPYPQPRGKWPLMWSRAVQIDVRFAPRIAPVLLTPRSLSSLSDDEILFS